MSAPRHVVLPDLGLANYLSFGEQGFLLSGLGKVNVFIGKNNAGKSNVLRALDFLRGIKKPAQHVGSFDQLLHGHRRQAGRPSALVGLATDSILAEAPRKGTPRDKDHLRTLLGPRCVVRWETESGKRGSLGSVEKLPARELFFLAQLLSSQPLNEGIDRSQLLDLVGHRLAALALKTLGQLDDFLHIPVFREVGTAKREGTEGWAFDGRDIIPRLREMQHPRIGRESDRDTFRAIERFAQDLVNVPDLKLEVPAEDNQVIVTMHENRLPLASFGTGVHHLVILCSALAMHERHVVCIEEPEVHLHPELQRKFLRFIAERTDNVYFLTTHSNVFLDTLPDVRVYHVRHDGEQTKVEGAASAATARLVLDDMGYAASDLLQSNGIIWVEGPSDRVYLKRWLSLVDGSLVEGIHYSVVFYGGKLLAHLTGSDDHVEDFVQVLRVNRNAVVMMDRDGDSDAAMLNRSKARIVQELGEEGCWVTAGREVENYLHEEVLNTFLSNKYQKQVRVACDRDGRVEAAIEAATAGETPRVRYAEDKPRIARELASLTTDSHLDVLDLRERLSTLVGRIREWNYISPVPQSPPSAS